MEPELLGLLAELLRGWGPLGRAVVSGRSVGCLRLRLSVCHALAALQGHFPCHSFPGEIGPERQSD